MAKKDNSLYLFRSLDEPRQYACVKMDENYTIQGQYYLEDKGHYATCDCPWGSMDRSCRHSKMLRVFQRNRAIDQSRVFNYTRGIFLEAAE